MRAAVLLVYWLLSIFFVLMVIAVPASLLAAIWTEDGRWGWTALIAGLAGFCAMMVAAAIEE